MTAAHLQRPQLEQTLDATDVGIRKGMTKVLIVDNHALVRRGLAALVSAEGDMVSCGDVPCTEAVLDTVAALRPDVVVMDVSTPDATCLRLMQRIRKGDAHVRIIALAMTDKPGLMERVLDAGAASLVLKNDLVSRILTAIRRDQKQRRMQNVPRRPFSQVPRQSASRIERRLDIQERAIVEMIGLGVPTRAIAVRVGLSVSMVEGCRRRIRTKLNHPTASQLVQFCVRWTERSRSSASQA
jgi:DNA-binding NarL/FixJ family response regulator